MPKRLTEKEKLERRNKKAVRAEIRARNDIIRYKLTEKNKRKPKETSKQWRSRIKKLYLKNKLSIEK